MQNWSMSTVEKSSFGINLVRIGCILCFYIAMMGDEPSLNRKVGGAPKIVSLGIVGIALLFFFIVADFDRIKEALNYLWVFLGLILMLFLWSVIVWIMGFVEFSSISRGISKLLYQSIAISNAVACCYLLEDEAFDVFFISLCLANASIMVLEIPKFGLGASINSLVHCIITFGDAKGYVKELELHDITFTFGQCMIYLINFAPRETTFEKRKRWVYLLFGLLFMITGLKRATFLTIALVTIVVFILRKMKHPLRMIMFIGCCLFLFGYFYIWFVRNGYFTELMNILGVDMLGRDSMWRRTNEYYEISPFFMGRGFESVSDLVSLWVKSGIMKRRLPFHNDYLKVFVELGFGGFTIWSLIQTVLYPIFWGKKFGKEPALFYMAIFLYMSVTYLTDNTAFYFWSTTGLRLLPMAFSMRYLGKGQKDNSWVPPDANKIADEFWRSSLEEGENIG